MCLILLAWRAHPDFPLVVAANRDEFHARPTAPAGFWPDHPQVLAGRDLVAGGTWMGTTKHGRFAALTNFRDPAHMRREAPSRGPLVSDFLCGAMAPLPYLQSLAAHAGDFNGFNLLAGDRQEIYWYSNVAGQIHALAPGVYGLSNELLDTPWPKVEAAKSDLAQALDELPDERNLFHLLRDDHVHPDDTLPRTGVSLELERMLSAAFIKDARGHYGTRNSTLLLRHRSNRVCYDEQSWLPDASLGPRHRFVFTLSS
ncbi:NRDE family protein [Denitratisoma sp. agr-D3]